MAVNGLNGVGLGARLRYQAQFDQVNQSLECVTPELSNVIHQVPTSHGRLPNDTQDAFAVSQIAHLFTLSFSSLDGEE